MKNELTFNEWARKEQPWLLSALKNDGDRLLRLTALSAFEAWQANAASIDEPSIPYPVLAPEELYAGIIVGGPGEQSYHLILIEVGDTGMEWQVAREWAQLFGGDLPTRREQALLLANLKSSFADYPYWSDEQYEREPTQAYFQNFGHGAQLNGYKDTQFFACAVRRLVIFPRQHSGQGSTQ